MTTLLLLLALSRVEGLAAQSGPLVEKSGLFEYTRPEGWTRQPVGDGSFRLAPPGGGTELLRFLPPEAWAGSAEDYHRAVLKALQVDGEILSGGVPERFGAFLRSEAHARGLPMAPELATGDLGLREVTRLCETVYVDELLRRTEGNVSRAADIAGITRPNMHRKVVDLGLTADSYRRP